MKPIIPSFSFLDRSHASSFRLVVFTFILICALGGCSSKAYKSTPAVEEANIPSVKQPVKETTVKTEPSDPKEEKSLEAKTSEKASTPKTVAPPKTVKKQAIKKEATVKKIEKKTLSKTPTKAKPKKASSTKVSKKTESATKTKKATAKQKSKPAEKAKPKNLVKVHKPEPKAEPVVEKLSVPKEAPQVEAEAKATDTATPRLVNLDSLPLNIGSEWTLDRELNQTNTKSCFLSYAPQKMEDGQGPTPALLKVTHDTIVLKTKSNIDTSYPAAGLTIDSNPQIPIEKLFNLSSIIYKDHYTKVIQQMTEGEQATFAIGFWPTWPVTQTYPVSFDLTNFSEAYSTLQSCLALEQQLK